MLAEWMRKKRVEEANVVTMGPDEGSVKAEEGEEGGGGGMSAGGAEDELRAAGGKRGAGGGGSKLLKGREEGEGTEEEKKKKEKNESVLDQPVTLVLTTDPEIIACFQACAAA
jgi:hypothetical protein